MNKRYWATALVIPAVFGLFATSNALADNTTVTVNVTNISLELDVPSDPVVLTLRPTATGANFGSVDLTATVGTNNPAGYQLSVEFSDTSLIRTAAIGNDTPEINTLDDLSGGYAENDFTVNRWGQKVTGDNYFPVPSGTLAPASWSSDEPVNNADNIITLAAKADGTIPSGTYEVTLTYTLVANVADPDPNTTTFDEAYAAAGKSKDSTSDKYKMQDMTPEICSAVTDEQTTILVDTRDGNVYNVVKALDHRCWLSDNLALDPVANGSNLTPSNTNATQAAIDNYLTSSGTAPQAGWSTVAVDYANDVLYNDQPRINIASISTVPQGSNDPLKDLANTESWKVGVYYNYCAASIGTYCYAGGSGVDKPNTAIDAEYDICPAGWRMPTGSSYDATNRPDGGEYQALYNAYPAIGSGDSQYTRFRKALRLPLSGFSLGSASYQGSQGSGGRFWSSTYYNSSSMYYLLVNTSNIYPQNNSTRYSANSIRCIARTGTEPAPSGN